MWEGGCRLWLSSVLPGLGTLGENGHVGTCRGICESPEAVGLALILLKALGIFLRIIQCCGPLLGSLDGVSLHRQPGYGLWKDAE